MHACDKFRNFDDTSSQCGVQLLRGIAVFVLFCKCEKYNQEVIAGYQNRLTYFTSASSSWLGQKAASTPPVTHLYARLWLVFAIVQQTKKLRRTNFITVKFFL